jgi:xanthine dehydrogenase accessory factor
MDLRIADLTVLIRGGGEMASGIAHRLHSCHMKVVITEVAEPTSVRRAVSFAEAVYRGCCSVENVRARRVFDVADVYAAWDSGEIPVLVDPSAAIRDRIEPLVVVDAIMAKRNLGTAKSDASLVIGVGPGFNASADVHAVVESNRGYKLGRVCWTGAAAEDTRVPAPVLGYTTQRVLRAPHTGRFTSRFNIGDMIKAGDIVADVDGHPMAAEIGGVLRGILKDGILVDKGVKAGDIDPRGKGEYCYMISDKARAIGGGVLEAILHAFEGLSCNGNAERRQASTDADIR